MTAEPATTAADNIAHYPGAARERLLLAASDLFCRYGINATGVDAIVAAAGTAKTTLYKAFGSKEGLLRAVLEGVAGPLNQARAEALERAKAKAGVNPIPIEDIVEAVLHPYIFGPEGRENAGMIFLRIALANRVRPTDLGRALIREYLEPIAQQLLHALREALPDLSDAEIHWRYHFMISSVLATLADMEVGGRFHTLSKGECDVTDKAEILRQLVRFLSAGLRAPRGP